jgi:hypothetical protein
MNFLKAFPENNKPFLSFHFCAASLEKLTEMGLVNDPLIISEADLPEPINGVCALKIENGALVARSAAEIASYEAAWLESQNALLIKQKRFELKELFNEIAFTGSLNEDTTALDAAYATKLADYNNLQTS